MARKGGSSPGVKVTAEDLARIWLDDAGRCRYCGIEVGLMTASFDHVEPLSKGGYHGYANLATCCLTCQRSKYVKDVEQFAEWRALWVHCKTCGKGFKPRWADYIRGYGRYHSRSCSGKAAHA